MKKRSVFALLAALLLVPVLALAADFAAVRGGTLNLRSYPSTDSSSIGSYPTGTWVRILGSSSNGFYHVRTMSGRNGYMKGSYLNFGTGSAVGTAKVSTRNGGRVNVRKGPSSSYGAMISVRSGTKVSVLVRGNGWYKVRVNGVTGYMSTSYLSGTGGGGSSGLTGTAYVNNPHRGQILFLRQYPSTSAKSIGQYYSGTRVTVVSNDGTWAEVYVNGRHGYMMARYLRFEVYYGTDDSNITYDYDADYDYDIDDDDDEVTPKPTVKPKPTPTPTPSAGTTPAPGTQATLVDPGNTEGITVYSDSGCTSVKGTYESGKSVMILQYGTKVTMILVDSSTAYVSTGYLNY